VIVDQAGAVITGTKLKLTKIRRKENFKD